MPKRHDPIRGLDNPVTVAYVAGLIDNSGRIRIERIRANGSTYYGLEVHIHSTQAAPIEWLIENLGGSWVWSNRLANGRRWRVFGPNAEALVRATQPHLVRRAREAELAIQFRDTFADVRFSGPRQQTRREIAAKAKFFDQMKALNHGRPVERRGRPRVVPTRTAYVDRIGLTRNLADHLRDHWSVQKIAEHYRVAPSAVATAARRNGFDCVAAMRADLGAADGRYAGMFGLLTDDDRAAIARRYGHGERPARIADDYGVSEHTVRAAVRRKGGAMRLQGATHARPRIEISDRQAEAIAACYRAGDTLRDLATFGGVSEHYIKKALEQTNTPLRPGGRRRKEYA